MKFRQILVALSLMASLNIFSQACTLANYMSAFRIPLASYPYFLSGPGITVSATTVGVPTLGDFSYVCSGNTFSGASPTWWINTNTGTITLNFSAPVTSITYLFNGSNSGEEFYVTPNTGLASVTISNYCTPGMSSVGNTLTCGPTAGLGSLLTVNNPVGATQYRLTHNGAGSGSRVTLLECVVPLNILPVELVEFKAACSSGKVELKWKTNSEKSNDYFTIERSKDAADWQSIGRVKGAGSTSAVKQYSFIDHEPLTGRVYYRLKQTDLNGDYTSSSFTTVEDCSSFSNGNIAVYPNPAANEIFITGDVTEEVQIFDLVGNKVLSKKCGSEKENRLNIDELPQGIYYIKIGDKNHKFIKEQAK